jgi:hypothetical protein
MTRHCRQFNSCAAYATPCPMFPALQVTTTTLFSTPCRSLRVRVEGSARTSSPCLARKISSACLIMAFKAPRILKLLVHVARLKNGYVSRWRVRHITPPNSTLYDLLDPTYLFTGCKHSNFKKISRPGASGRVYFNFTMGVRSTPHMRSLRSASWVSLADAARMARSMVGGFRWWSGTGSTCQGSFLFVLGIWVTLLSQQQSAKRAQSCEGEPANSSLFLEQGVAGTLSLRPPWMPSKVRTSMRDMRCLHPSGLGRRPAPSHGLCAYISKSMQHRPKHSNQPRRRPLPFTPPPP